MYEKAIYISSNNDHWTRSDIISALEENDPNGCYSDRDNEREFGYCLSDKCLVELFINEIVNKEG